MKKSKAQKVVATAGVVLAGAIGVTGAVAVAAPVMADGNTESALAERDASIVSASGTVQEESVIGTFAWSQKADDSDVVAHRLERASQNLCGSRAREIGEVVSPDQWLITVNGDVENAYSATLSELAANGGEARYTMGCTCAGNPAGGLASANADVLGVTISSILENAVLKDGANTIVFKSSDGYQIELPLLYVMQRFSIITYEVNGECITDTIGGSNQLWVGSTAANYFARDIVEITIETRDTPPARPGSLESGDVHDNLPNISVYAGSEQ